MNETFMQLDFPPLYTAATRGERIINVRSSLGNPKLGCTVALTIGSNGEKMPAHVVFREPGFVRQIRDLENIPDNVRVTSSRSGWENRDTLQHWLNDFCTPIVEAGVLIDNIPAGCTSLSQPLDLTIMRSFKTHMRRHWKEWKQQNTRADGSCDRITLQTVLRLIGHAWNDLRPASAAKAFQVAGLTPDKNGQFRNIADNQNQPPVVVDENPQPPVVENPQPPVVENPQPLVEDEDDEDGLVFQDYDSDGELE